MDKILYDPHGKIVRLTRGIKNFRGSSVPVGGYLKLLGRGGGNCGDWGRVDGYCEKGHLFMNVPLDYLSLDNSGAGRFSKFDKGRKKSVNKD